MSTFLPISYYGNKLIGKELDKSNMRNFFWIRKFFPILIISYFLILQFARAQDMPLIPMQSDELFSEVQKLNDWNKTRDMAASLQYFSSSSQEIAMQQYLINAKLFLLKKAVSSLFLPLKKLELQPDVFQANFFALTKKFCQVETKTNFDWGSLSRQLFLLSKDKKIESRWDDKWSQDNLPLDMQQKVYTTRVVRALDAVKYLCTRETRNDVSIVRAFLKDQIIAANFTNYLIDQNAIKFYCESPLFCRQVSHQDFEKRLPRSMLDYPWDKEMVNLWKTFVDSEPVSWTAIKEEHKNLSVISAQQSVLHLRDEFLHATDFFMMMSVLTKHQNTANQDPILLSLKPVLDNLADSKIQKYTKKIEWEEPFEIELANATTDKNFIALDLIARKGGLDQIIDKAEKIKISDQIVFDRGFLEWLIRATLNIRYDNELLYWKNHETVHTHLVSKIQYYINERAKVFPHLERNKLLANIMADWILDKRNDIAQYLISNPNQKVFNFTINHYLGLSALESNLVKE